MFKSPSADGGSLIVLLQTNETGDILSLGEFVAKRAICERKKKDML